MKISLTVNGSLISASIEPRTQLADFLREERGLTGTHLGCEHGVCGACTVLADGAPIRSCITLAVACDGADIVTIEGFDSDGIMAELREAFTHHHALQCGYCTPGMLIAARDVVIRSQAADEGEIRVAMSGNLCRCTGYAGIIRAIKAVIAARRSRGIAPIAGAGILSTGPAGSGHAPAGESPLTAPARSVAEPAEVRQPIAAPRIDHSWTPQTTFDQNVIVHYPREKVWAFFGRVADVAACLPGASLTDEPAPDHVRGRIRVRVGPIVAEFSGEAQIERDASTYSGSITGAGTDPKSGSSTRGMIRYRLLEAADGQATEVVMNIGYTLTGMLAQFGRSGIVRDVAARLTSTFVQNLEARLSGKSGADLPAAKPVNAVSLIFHVFSARIRDLFSKLLGLR